MIKAIIFDFGGVLAEEGFREGLIYIAQKSGIDPVKFLRTAEELIYETGYVLGLSDEAAYLNALREKTGINDDNNAIKKEILKRFALRREMIKIAERAKAAGFITAILSDQTNWLDEINLKTPFYHHFDFVFNSFKLKKGKRDPSIFMDACSTMRLRPNEAVFVDDNAENIKRAALSGMKTIHFRNIDDFVRELGGYIPAIF